MTDLASVDELLGPAPPMLANSPMPSRATVVQPESVDELLGPPPEQAWTRKTDYQIQQSMFRFINGFGYGVRQPFVETPLPSPATAFSPETMETLKQRGLINDYLKGQRSFTATMFEGTVLPAVAALEFAGRAAEAGIEAPIEAFGQMLGYEPGSARGAAGDPFIQLLTAGMFPELTRVMKVPRAPADLERDVLAARADGVTGEGEAGFYDARPIPPDAAQARTTAAQEAGIEPPVPRPVPKDVHELARRIEPETLAKYDAKVAEIGHLEDSVADLPDETSKQAIDAHERIVAAQKELNDLAPDVAEAYRQAHEMMPPPSDAVPEQIVAASEGKAAETVAEVTPSPKREAPIVQYRKDLAEIETQLPPVQPGFTRLWRGNRPGEEGQNQTFTNDAAGIAIPFQKVYGGKLTYVDVPEADLAAYENKVGAAPGAEFTVPPEIAQQARAAPEPRTQAAGQRVGPLRPVEGSGDIVASKLAEGIEAKAIEENLTQGFGDLQEHGQVNMAEQAQKTVEFMNKDYEAAKAVAMGEKAPPKGLLLASVMNGVEMRARAEGDIELIRALATESKATRQVTTMAQNIRTLAERDRASPVAAIQEVQAARAAHLEARNATAVKDAVKEIKAAVRTAAPSRDAWASFITAITCPE